MASSATPSKSRRRWRHTIDARKRLQQTPGIIEAYRTFAPVYDLLRDLARGEANAVHGRVVLLDWEQEYCEAATALDGWVSCWERISDGEGLDIDLAPLAQLQRYLSSGVLLTPELIDRAKISTDACYAAYRRIPRECLQSYSRTELIAIELDTLGLRDHGCKSEDVA